MVAAKLVSDPGVADLARLSLRGFLADKELHHRIDPSLDPAWASKTFEVTMDVKNQPEDILQAWVNEGRAAENIVTAFADKFDHMSKPQWSASSVWANWGCSSFHC